MPSAVYSDEKAAPLFEAGIEARAALCLLAAMLTVQGKALPPRLADHAAKALFDRAFVFDGRRHKTTTRDMHIISFMKDLRRRGNSSYPGRIRRQGIGQFESAEKFGLEVRTIEDVWSKRSEAKPYVRPLRPPMPEGYQRELDRVFGSDASRKPTGGSGEVMSGAEACCQDDGGHERHGCDSVGKCDAPELSNPPF